MSTAYHTTGVSSSTPLATSSGSWVSDNALLTNTSTFSYSGWGSMYVDLGSSGIASRNVVIDFSGSGATDGNPYLYGSNDGSTWTSITFSTSSLSFGAPQYVPIAQTYRYYQLVFECSPFADSAAFAGFNVIPAPNIAYGSTTTITTQGNYTVGNSGYDGNHPAIGDTIDPGSVIWCVDDTGGALIAKDISPDSWSMSESGSYGFLTITVPNDSSLVGSDYCAYYQHGSSGSTDYVYAVFNIVAPTVASNGSFFF